ncbi:conjugal transfer pilin signal peptidase TrbI [Thiohalospira halophila DSM 15071]|uniref:Signal peptidase I n=1 Tax=Thiohalospira halophila DSM 15071 TaxID=1123397 RepID=A0A1I1N2V9_9GAMM|nr:S26 family signal peptidase [Thiohalospira halophila]SFC91686.1 conjugal transfer pilin signal peptidase TrbI [Thiohalospira halophila DSM 15071]
MATSVSMPDAVPREERRRRREPWGRFALKAGLTLAGIVGFWAWFMAHFTVHIDPQETPSMGHRLWLVVHEADYRPQRGEVAAFRSRGASPYFEDGVVMGKRVVATPGDWVGRLGDVVVHARPGESGDILGVLHHASRVEPGVRRLPDGHWWVMGESPSSWDSRYWGAVQADQWIGPAHPIF